MRLEEGEEGAEEEGAGEDGEEEGFERSGEDRGPCLGAHLSGGGRELGF